MPETLRGRRRAEIVAAARAVVAEEGLEALTFAALEGRLEFTRGVVTYHFRDKDELVHAVLKSAVDEIASAVSAAVRASRTPEDKLRAVLRATTAGFLTRPEAGRVLLSFWSRLAVDPRVRARNARLYAAYRRQTARLIAEGVRSGAFPAVKPGPVAALVVGIVIGIAAQSYFEPGAIDAEAAVEEAAAALLARLRPAEGRGLRSRRPRSP